MTDLLETQAVGATVRVESWQDLDRLNMLAVTMGQASHAPPHATLRRLEIVCPRQLLEARAGDGLRVAAEIRQHWRLECPWLDVTFELTEDGRPAATGRYATDAATRGQIYSAGNPSS